MLLQRLDDEIFQDLSESFPELVSNPEALAKLDEDGMKNKVNKDRWRPFMMRYA